MRWREAEFPITLRQEEYHQGGAQEPCPGFRACWWDDIRLFWRRGRLFLLLETPPSDTAGAAAASFPWTHWEWPTWALGRRDPGRWVPWWLLLLRTSSSEIWSSSFWRRKWEPPAEPSSWSWLEGKDSGWRMSSGRTPLVHLWVSFVNSSLESQEPWVSSQVGKRWWNQGTDLRQLVRGNKMSGDWIESYWK